MNPLSVCSFPQTYLDLVFPCILWKYINIINYKKGPQFAQRIEIELLVSANCLTVAVLHRWVLLAESISTHRAPGMARSFTDAGVLNNRC